MEHWQVLVGENVRRLRHGAGLSQERLAVDVGIDLTYLGGIERGRRNPSLKVLVSIATALGVAPAELLVPKDGPGAKK